jgi:hypothetical protein
VPAGLWNGADAVDGGASIAAEARPPGVATSVLVTFMFAQEQRRTLKTVTIKSFIIYVVPTADRPFTRQETNRSCFLMQLSCRFS